MSSRTGSINLATARNFTGNVPRSGIFSVQLLSTNLSADTTFHLQTSLDEIGWDTERVNDTDISIVLSVNDTKLESFVVEPSIKKWRLLFDGATTGTISYTVTAL